MNFTNSTGLVLQGSDDDDDLSKVQELDEVIVTADKYGIHLAN